MKTYKVPEGCKITSVDFNTGVVIFEAEKQEFKDGDFVFFKEYNQGYGETFGIFNKNGNCFFGFNKKYCKENFVSCGTNPDRLMTEEEKALLLSKMHEVGKDWDAEKKEVVDYVEIIEVGQEYWSVKLSTTGSFFGRKESCRNRRKYDPNDFKTEELADIAIKSLTETLTNLKHY